MKPQKLKKMVYAHKGSSNDNAFTNYDGAPTRTFMGFATKTERNTVREEIWQKSGKQENLIDCTRKFVEKHMGKDFILAPNGIVYSDYESYADEREWAEKYKNYMTN